MRSLASLFLVSFAFPSATAALPIVDEWRYTFRKPAGGWEQTGFNDSAWKNGFGGFGIPSTPGSRVGTHWATKNIWLRKTVHLENVPAKPALLIHHDESTEVFINGRQVVALKGYTTRFKVVLLDPATTKAIKKGSNLIAVHCNQTVGGQFIDVHLVDANNVPKLPKAKRGTKPFITDLITKWGAEVTPENAWTEYPRPQLRRDNWMNLNGEWDFAITPARQKKAPKKWAGKILVPFSLESKLSRVQRLLDASEALWYRRKFSARPAASPRTILHFEAVDYRTAVFVNGKSIPIKREAKVFEDGVHYHLGGNTPFWVDATEALREDGENELIVRVEDDTEAWQLRGKQTLNPRGIWYTQVSGIWQTVWLEQVPLRGLRDLQIATDARSGSITVKTRSIFRAPGDEIEVIVRDGSREVARSRGRDSEFRLVVKNAKLWSPASPHLYDIEVTQFDEDGDASDQVMSYAGIRTVAKAKDANGHWRFTLNGKPIFHWGPLDQGWWPDGLLTPPSDEAMLFEIKWLKEAGFNMIRKHIKVEPRRYYHHCDRLGMMVWQDHVSGGQKPKWTRLQPDPQDAKWPAREHQQFMLELDRMITALESHPSIVSWVPFNEAWGQHRTVEVGKWTVKRDPSRLINVASGGNFWPVGDIVDEHRYPHPGFPFDLNQNGRFDNFIKVMGEFGGHGYPVKGHLWDADRRNWGYGGLPQNAAEYKKRYLTSIKMLKDLIGKGIAGGVYTQTTDVEGEINGLMTYDRKVIKIPAKELAKIHRQLFQ